MEITRCFTILFLFSILPFTTSSQSAAYYCPPCNSSCDEQAFEAAGDCPHCGMALVAQTAAERERELSQGPMRIAFYLQDGVEVLDFAGPMEVFSYAGYEVFTVSRTQDAITSQGILKVIPDYSIEDAPPADILAFFGGNSGEPTNDEAVIRWVREQKERVQYYFSVCTGAFILGKAGLLDGLTVTTFHRSIDQLRQAVPKAKVLADVRFVDNGAVITTAGISAGIDGALHLVSKLKGTGAARRVAEYMEYDKWEPEDGLIIEEGAGGK